MYINRSTLTPIVLAAVLFLWILSFASHIAAVTEFGCAVRTRYMQERHELPAVTDWFKSSHRFYWVMPVAFGIWGGLMLLRRTTATEVAWYASTAVVLGVCWICFALLSLYLCNQVFYTLCPEYSALNSVCVVAVVYTGLEASVA